jgi:hypothetical protein
LVAKRKLHLRRKKLHLRRKQKRKLLRSSFYFFILILMI